MNDYLDFEANDGDISLAGGTLTSTLGGPSQWVQTQCPDDWDYPLQPSSEGDEVSSEIDWLRFFWQFTTTPAEDLPTFWDTTRTVTFTQEHDPWDSTGELWPNMHNSIDQPASEIDGYIGRFEEVSVDNGVYNAPP